MKNHIILIFITSVFLFFSCSRGLNHTRDHETNIHSHEAGAANQSVASSGEEIQFNESDKNRETLHSEVYSAGIRLDTVRTGTFAEIIKTGGVLMAGNENLVLITAKSSGIIMFTNPILYPGMKVARSQILFIVSGGNLADSNPAVRLVQIKSDLDRAEANYARAQKLLPEKIITQEHFLAVKNEYEKILAEYENLSLSSGGNGIFLVSPADGYIRDIFVKEGQKIISGETVASVRTTGRMVLKALLPPGKMNKAASVRSAWFIVAGSDQVYKTEELNGKTISYSKSTGNDSYYLPLFFSIDFLPDVPEEIFAEVFLRGDELKGVISVPDEAIMEEFGKYYVFVKDGHGDFFKRYIKKGGTDGERTLISEGLTAGEVFVSEGTYQVKLQQMSGSVPAHVHHQ
ncbi:MAG: efflux RND transporter periplasmic adaptor subunit [Bacteroidales bacterium]